MNTRGRLGMHERHADTSEEAQGHQALFRIVEAVVFKGERRASKDLLRIYKIQAVLSQVGAALRLVPGKLHLKTIYTDRIYVKRGGRIAEEGGPGSRALPSAPM